MRLKQVFPEQLPIYVEEPADKQIRFLIDCMIQPP